MHVGGSRAMKRMSGMTAEERGIFWCAMNNLAQDVAYRVHQFNDALDEKLKPSIQKRREREMFKAIERLATRYNEGISDAELRYFSGPPAVRERDKKRGAASNVIPLKRGGRPLLPLQRDGE